MRVPQRVVSLQPSASVTFDRLGLLERIVGCTKWCLEVCPRLRDYAPMVVSDAWAAQAAEIAACRPDLVIASVPYQLDSVAEILKSGVRFLALSPRTLDDIYLDIAIVSGVMHAGPEGAALLREMQNAVAASRAAVHEHLTSRGETSPLVYCEEWGKPLIASQPWVAELVEAAGGRFLGTPGKVLDSTAVQSANPDIIIAAWCGAGNRVPLERIVSLRGWQKLAAVKRRRVFCINDEYLNTPGPTLLAGLRALQCAIAPDLFGNSPGLRRIAASLHSGSDARVF